MTTALQAARFASSVEDRALQRLTDRIRTGAATFTGSNAYCYTTVNVLGLVVGYLFSATQKHPRQDSHLVCHLRRVACLFYTTGIGNGIATPTGAAPAIYASTEHRVCCSSSGSCHVLFQ